MLGEVVDECIPIGFRIYPDMCLEAEARVVVEAAHGNHNPALARVGGEQGAAAELAERGGIGHSSCLLAQRPSMGVMLNP